MGLNSCNNPKGRGIIPLPFSYRVFRANFRAYFSVLSASFTERNPFSVSSIESA